MDKPEFDKFAKEYDRVLAESIPDELNEDAYFAEYKIALMAKRLEGRHVDRILDYGCGAGRSLPFLHKYFPGSDIWGFDVSPESLAVASQRSPQSILFSDWSSVRGTSFDAIVAANVFHHVPVADRPDALASCRGALGPEGQMFLFEHNPYNPVTRWIFERCPFDSDAEMISLPAALKLAGGAGFRTHRHAYTLFFPKPLAFLRRMEPWLERLPLGAQYYVQMAR